MSLEYTIYLKRTDTLTKKAIEEYAASIGLSITLHPDVQLISDEGFCPICMKDDRFVQKGSGNLFLTGFELFPSEYEEDMEDQPESKVKGSSFVLDLCCSAVDSFETLMAYVLGAFCIKKCDGVFEDLQAERYYHDSAEIEQEIEIILEELISEAKHNRLRMHKFERWI
jgi:hypothetical protein